MTGERKIDNPVRQFLGINPKGLIVHTGKHPQAQHLGQSWAALVFAHFSPLIWSLAS